jgi:hypothetical protein
MTTRDRLADDLRDYAPGDWTPQQLMVFASEICPHYPVDLGIVRAVKVLLDSDVEAFESCEGGEGHAFPQPTIRFGGTVEAGWRALAICLNFGFPVSALRRYWTIDGREPVGPSWEIVFRDRL